MGKKFIIAVCVRDSQIIYEERIVEVFSFRMKYRACKKIACRDARMRKPPLLINSLAPT